MSRGGRASISHSKEDQGLAKRPKPTWHRTLFIESGSPWENGYNETFHGKLRDELLNGEIFYTLKEAKILVESGGGITTRCGHIVLLGIGLRHQKSLRRCP